MTVNDSQERAKPIADVHAPGGLGFTYCGLRLSSKRVKWSGADDEVTCPSCRQNLNPPESAR